MVLLRLALLQLALRLAAGAGSVALALPLAVLRLRLLLPANGQFDVAVPPAIARSFTEDYAGASVQVAKFGFYVGPVSLGPRRCGG